MTPEHILEAVSGVAPMVREDTGRTLLIDGDALAYVCAGNDSTPPHIARENIRDRIAGSCRSANCTKFLLLLTGSGSDKGKRYAVARRKPYQGTRNSGRRPTQWRTLREGLEAGSFGPIEITQTAEADDLFAKYSADLGADRVVIHTADKDLRMVPGHHLGWDDLIMRELPPDTFRAHFDGKVYGLAWFWMQTLHGDSADNVPGLPAFPDGVYASGPKKGEPKLSLCGPKSRVVRELGDVQCNKDALNLVLNAYRGYYGDDAEVELLEQGILLWMRRNPEDPFDVLRRGGPLCDRRFLPAAQEIKARLEVPA